MDWVWINPIEFRVDKFRKIFIRTQAEPITPSDPIPIYSDQIGLKIQADFRLDIVFEEKQYVKTETVFGLLTINN